MRALFTGLFAFLLANIQNLDFNQILTVFLIIPAFWLALISRNTAKRQLRAYVSVGTDDLRLERDKATAKWVVNFSYKNNGITPAYFTTIETGHFLANNEDARLPPAEAPYALGTMGPSVCIHDAELTDLTDADVEALKSGVKTFVFFGQVRYRDAFKKWRQTRFRFFTGGSAPFAGPADSDLTIYVKGNDSN